MKKKQLLSLVLAMVLLALSLTACGSDEGSLIDTPEWVYVPEFLSLDEMENISWYDVELKDDSLCYVSRDWDMESETSSYTFNRYLLSDGSTFKLPLNVPEDAYVNEWALGKDGSLCTLMNAGNWDEVTQVYTQTWYLCKFDAQGNQVYLQDITGLQEGEYAYFNGIVMDDEGRAYIIGDATLWMFDSEGNPAGETGFGGAMGGYVNDFFCGLDGNVYASVNTYGEDGMSTSLYVVDFASKKMEEKYADFPMGRNNGSLIQNADGKFLTNNGLAVQIYDPETSEEEVLFTWLDSDINGESVRSFSAMPDGRIAVVYQDWMNDDNGVALLTKTKYEELPEKEQIIIATLYSDQELQAAAVQFNKSSNDYRVMVKQYYDWNSDMSYEDAITNLNNDISSRNCPDLVLISGNIDVNMLAAKGVFQDLSSYLEKSDVLDRENMVESVLNAYTYDGKLIAVPDNFTLATIFGSRDMVGDEMGWSLEDMIAFSDANPGKDLFDTVSKSEILSICLMYNMDTFVDWNKGSCNFDSPEFKSLLEFAARFEDADDIDYDPDRPATPVRIQRGEVLLLEETIYEMNEIQLYKEMFLGDVTPIGLPNTDGTSGCILSANGCYAIAAKSKVKDGAWAFIESYLTRENTGHRWGLPNDWNLLDEMAKEAVREYEVDENGEILLDEEGNPVERQVNHGYGWGDFSYDYRVSTQEEVDMVYELINAARPASGTNQQIMTIITEEAEAFFQGQKTVDEVTPIIQSRVNVYVSENS